MKALLAISTLCLLTGCIADEPPPAVAPHALTADLESLELAGSGAATPLFQAFASQWAARASSPRLVVEPSLGSRGGILAARDGAIDLGLVSRPLQPDELALGLSYVSIAWDAVIFAANRACARGDVSSAEVLTAIDGDRSIDSPGVPCVPLLRDRAESANAAMEPALPGLGEARERAYPRRRLRVLYHDDTMTAALLTTPGAFGLVGFGELTVQQLPLKPLALNGRAPTPETIRGGGWKAMRPIGVVFRSDRASRVTPLLAWIRSSEGAELIRTSGYFAEGPK